ncbi:MAG: hypothetical protein ACR2PL_05060, partial [Dehalococcoidia bacterium]
MALTHIVVWDHVLDSYHPYKDIGVAATSIDLIVAVSLEMTLQKRLPVEHPLCDVQIPRCKDLPHSSDSRDPHWLKPVASGKLAHFVWQIVT